MAEQHAYECEHANLNNYDHDDIPDQTPYDPLAIHQTQATTNNKNLNVDPRDEALAIANNDSLTSLLTKTLKVLLNPLRQNQA